MYTRDEIIERFRLKHGETYDYSNVVYTKLVDKVEIICKKHGSFYQTPHAHLKGQGCPKCAIESRSVKKSYTTDSFVEKANRVHLGKYDYSKVEYVDSMTKVCIICPEHGEFWQRPDMHLSGRGCKQCTHNRLKDTETFIKDAKTVHGDKYDYSKVNYTNSNSDVTVICPIHGEFTQKATKHLMGHGCPKCGIQMSNNENEIYEYICSIYDGEIIQHDRNVLDGLELDIYIPSLKVAIEYNGLYWHSELYKDKKYHLDKTNKCLENGIRLIHIFEDEWDNKKDICKSRLSNILNVTPTRIYARKCMVCQISNSDANHFLEKNHIQGRSTNQLSYGLLYNGELVSVMTFCKLRKNLGNSNTENKYELLRFCNKLNTTVIGGAGKLLKAFESDNNVSEIVSYADRRWSIGGLYEQLGFTHSHNSQVNYFYIIDGLRKNRFGYRKDLLISKYGCEKTDTEHNFCYNKGWYRIYDCGTMVFKKEM